MGRAKDRPEIVTAKGQNIDPITLRRCLGTQRQQGIERCNASRSARGSAFARVLMSGASQFTTPQQRRQ